MVVHKTRCPKCNVPLKGLLERGKHCEFLTTEWNICPKCRKVFPK